MTFRIIPRISDVLFERFWSNVERRGVCWVWTGRLSGRRGVMRIGNIDLLVHRTAFHWFCGGLDPDLTVHQRCGVPTCVRPSHLEAITLSESGRRGLWAGMAGRARPHDLCLRQASTGLPGTIGERPQTCLVARCTFVLLQTERLTGGNEPGDHLPSR